VQNPILAVSLLWWAYFPTDRHKNLNWDITNQRWLCTRWSTKPEIEFRFREVQISVLVSISSGGWLRPQFFTDFHQILHATQKCGCFKRYCFWDKPEVVYHFRDVQNPILAVSLLWWTYFPTDCHKNPKWDITHQHWLCTRWSTKPEIEFRF